MMLKVLDVDGAVRRVSGGWTATGQDVGYDADRYAPGRAERAREQQAMLGYIATPGLPDGVPAPRARRSGRRAVRPVRQLHRAGPGPRPSPKPRPPPPGTVCFGRARS